MGIRYIGSSGKRISKKQFQGELESFHKKKKKETEAIMRRGVANNKPIILKVDLTPKKDIKSLNALKKDDRKRDSAIITGDPNRYNYLGGKTQKKIDTISYKYLPPYVRQVPIIVSETGSSLYRGAGKLAYRSVKPFTGRDIETESYWDYNRNIPLWTDPDVQTFALTGTLGATATATGALGYAGRGLYGGLLGYQGYRTFTEPSEKSITGLGLMSLPLAQPAIKHGKRQFFKTKSPFTPARKVFAQEVLTGKSKFPTARGVKDIQTKFLATRKGGQIQTTHTSLGRVKGSRTGIGGRSSRLNLQDRGLYVTPKGYASPHFLQVAQQNRYKFTWNPFKGAFDNPSITELSIGGFSRIPKKVLNRATRLAKTQGRQAGFKYINNWYRTQQGKAFVPLRSELGHTTELQGIIPAGSRIYRPTQRGILNRLRGTTGYTTYKGEVVPIYRHQITRPTGSYKTVSPRQLRRQIRSSQRYYQNLGTRYVTPYQYVTPRTIYYPSRSYIQTKYKPSYKSQYRSQSKYKYPSRYKSPTKYESPRRYTSSYKYPTKYKSPSRYPSTYRGTTKYKYPSTTKTPSLPPTPKPPISKPPYTPLTGSKRKTAWQPVLITPKNRRASIREYYETPRGALGRGMQVTDELPNHKTITIKRLVPQSVIRKGKQYKHKRKFFQKGGVYHEKKKFRKDMPLEKSKGNGKRKGGKFNWTGFVYATK